MEALYLLIPLSVLAVGAAVWLFLRMSDSGQFDDLDSPAHRILLDDDLPAQEGPPPPPPRETAPNPDSVRGEREP